MSGWTTEALEKALARSQANDKAKVGKESTSAPIVASEPQEKAVSPAMPEQLHTTAVMDAVACFSLSKLFLYVEYGKDYIKAKHISGKLVTITFK